MNLLRGSTLLFLPVPSSTGVSQASPRGEIWAHPIAQPPPGASLLLMSSVGTPAPCGPKGCALSAAYVGEGGAREGDRKSKERKKTEVERQKGEREKKRG